MTKTFRTFACLAILSLPLAVSAPLYAQEGAPGPQTPIMRDFHGSRHHGRFRACGCLCMMMQEAVVIPPEMTPPSGQEMPEMARLRQEIAAQYQVLQNHRSQMRAECQKMGELVQRMRDMRMQKRGSKAKPSTSKGNASPQNPSISGN